jgi:NAD(P)-dependent dehydrogenase (short-subunit alcohol dehydrogenase family)
MTEKRNILITGSSKGIGEACALHFTRQGHRVFAGVRKPEDAQRLQQQAGENLVPVFLDVTVQDQIDAAAKLIRAEVGEQGLWGLVNNAGSAVSGPLEFLPVDDLRWQFEVNYFGQVALTQAMLPLIRTAKGRVVNITSVSGRFVSPFLGPYAGSKHALETFSDALRRELARWDIKVISIQPSAIATPIWDTALARIQKMLDSLPPDAHRYYGKDFETMLAHTAASEKRGLPPQKVVDAVDHALFARRPRLRYPIGIQAWATTQIVRRFIPDRWVDWAVQLVLRRK